MPTKQNENISYASALEELEKILADMESNELDLDTLSEKVKRAAFLTKLCKTKLRSTTEEIDKILEDWQKERVEKIDYLKIQGLCANLYS